MTKLETWYLDNRLRVEGMGIRLLSPTSKPVHYIDGEYGRYYFRFIDRGNGEPDIEIMDTVLGQTVRHNLSGSSEPELAYDDAIKFILKLDHQR
jgi:hypothetical protein